MDDSMMDAWMAAHLVLYYNILQNDIMYYTMIYYTIIL